MQHQIQISQPRRTVDAAVQARSSSDKIDVLDRPVTDIRADDLFLDDDEDLDDLLDLPEDEDEAEEDILMLEKGEDLDLEPASETSGFSSLAPVLHAPIAIRPSPLNGLSSSIMPQVSIDDHDYRPSSRSSTPETSNSQAYIDPALLLFASGKPDAEAIARLIAASRTPSPEPAEPEEREKEESGTPLFVSTTTTTKDSRHTPKFPLTSPGTEDDLYALQSKASPPRRNVAVQTELELQQQQPSFSDSGNKSVSPTVRREAFLQGSEGSVSLPPSPRLKAKDLPRLHAAGNNASREQQEQQEKLAQRYHMGQQQRENQQRRQRQTVRV